MTSPLSHHSASSSFSSLAPGRFRHEPHLGEPIKACSQQPVPCFVPFFCQNAQNPCPEKCTAVGRQFCPMSQHVWFMWGVYWAMFGFTWGPLLNLNLLVPPKKGCRCRCAWFCQFTTIMYIYIYIHPFA